MSWQEETPIPLLRFFDFDLGSKNQPFPITCDIGYEMLVWPNCKVFPDLDVCRSSLKKQSASYVHPLNVVYLKTLESAFFSALDLGFWEEAAKVGEELIEGYR